MNGAVKCTYPEAIIRHKEEEGSTLAEDMGGIRMAVTVLTTCLAAGLAVGAAHGWVLVRLMRRAVVPRAHAI